MWCNYRSHTSSHTTGVDNHFVSTHRHDMWIGESHWALSRYMDRRKSLGVVTIRGSGKVIGREDT